MRSYVRAPAPDWRVADAPARPRLRALLARAVLTLLRWHEVARQRRALAAMDDHMLKDIGISRVDACREAARPFWDEGGDPWRSLP
jgi:uncharacterized protein YjiS (DUF1127 family)